MEKKTTTVEKFMKLPTDVTFPSWLDTSSWKTLEDATTTICKLQNDGIITVEIRDELLVLALSSTTLEGPPEARIPIAKEPISEAYYRSKRQK